MLLKEFGFEYFVNTVFIPPYKQIARKIFFRPLDFDYCLLHGYYIYDKKLEITPKGINKIISFLATRKIPPGRRVEFFSGLLAHNAYCHTLKQSSEAEAAIRDIIAKNSSEMIASLDILQQELFPSNQEADQFLSNLINSEFNLQLIQMLFSTRNYAIRMHKKAFGLEYLLLLLGFLDFKNFENWFYRTERDDLKKLYISALFTLWHIEIYTNKEFLFSRIPLLRAICWFKEYPVLRLNIVGDKKYRIEDIAQNPSFEQKDVLYIFIIYFGKKYWGINEEGMKGNTLLDRDLSFFQNNSFQKELTTTIFDDLYNEIYSIELWRSLVSLLKDTGQKKILQEHFINKLIALLKYEIQWAAFEKANVLGRLLFEVDDQKYLKQLENVFEKNSKKGILPYLYFRDNKSWQNCIMNMCFILIAFYVYYSAKDADTKNILSPFISEFENVKGRLSCYSEEVEKIIAKLLKQIKQSKNEIESIEISGNNK